MTKKVRIPEFTPAQFSEMMKIIAEAKRHTLLEVRKVLLGDMFSASRVPTSKEEGESEVLEDENGYIAVDVTKYLLNEERKVVFRNLHSLFSRVAGISYSDYGVDIEVHCTHHASGVRSVIVVSGDQLFGPLDNSADR
jgi:hypothetical protein